MMYHHHQDHHQSLILPILSQLCKFHLHSIRFNAMLLVKPQAIVVSFLTITYKDIYWSHHSPSFLNLHPINTLYKGSRTSKQMVAFIVPLKKINFEREIFSCGVCT